MKSTKSIENGIEIWRLPNGTYHREDGPAVIRPNGNNEWWVNGKRHRTDGPAIIRSDGYQEWWINGKLHRTDGPSIICSDGTQNWFINGQCITKEVKQWMKTKGYKWNKKYPWKKEKVAEFLLMFLK